MFRIFDNRGFTFLEIAAIIIVVGLMAAFAVPKYRKLTTDSKETSARISLGSIRSNITIFYANRALINGKASWPIPADFEIEGRLAEEPLPSNPYQLPENAPDSIVLAYTKGEVVGSRGGWCYNPETGDLWMNSNKNGENEW